MADEQNGSTNSGRQSDQSGQGGSAQRNGRIEADIMDQAYAEEYQNLDKTLDEIDSWMNKLEEQNDNLFQELDDLLESNKQARKELQESPSQASGSDDKMEIDEPEKKS